jgi:hypothetical protein
MKASNLTYMMSNCIHVFRGERGEVFVYLNKHSGIKKYVGLVV